jgi:hypothetical protein
MEWHIDSFLVLGAFSGPILWLGFAGLMIGASSIIGYSGGGVPAASR